MPLARSTDSKARICRNIEHSGVQNPAGQVSRGGNRPPFAAETIVLEWVRFTLPGLQAGVAAPDGDLHDLPDFHAHCQRRCPIHHTGCFPSKARATVRKGTIITTAMAKYKTIATSGTRKARVMVTT